jgi:hypothetical protein
VCLVTYGLSPYLLVADTLVGVRDQLLPHLICNAPSGGAADVVEVWYSA